MHGRSGGIDKIKKGKRKMINLDKMAELFEKRSDLAGARDGFVDVYFKHFYEDQALFDSFTKLFDDKIAKIEAVIKESLTTEFTKEQALNEIKMSFDHEMDACNSVEGQSAMKGLNALIVAAINAADAADNKENVTKEKLKINKSVKEEAETPPPPSLPAEPPPRYYKESKDVPESVKEEIR